MAGQENNRVTAFFVACILAEIGFIIAMPLVVLVFAGHWLDVKLGYRAVFIFVGMIVALALSFWIIYQKVKQIANN